MSSALHIKWPRRLAVALFVLAVVEARAQERIMLHGTVNNAGVSFLYDTGSVDSLLFRGSTERLGLKIIREPGAGSSDSTEECIVAFDSGSKKMRLAVRDRPGAGYFKDPIDGVLSWLDLEQVFQIDYEKNTIGAIGSPGDLKGWRKWELPADGRVLLFDCPGGQENARIGIDTGYPGGVILGAARWEKWRAAHAGDPATNVALVTSGNVVVVNDVLRAKHILIGGLALEDIPVTKAPPSIDTLFGHCDAILGIDALKRLKVMIDRKNRALYTAPIHVAANFDYNRLGAVFVPGEAGTGAGLVARVADGSPAFEAGIRDEDILVKVEEVEAANGRVTFNTVPFHTAMFEPLGTKLNITLRRDSRTFSVTVTLKDPSPVN